MPPRRQVAEAVERPTAMTPGLYVRASTSGRVLPCQRLNEVSVDRSAHQKRRARLDAVAVLITAPLNFGDFLSPEWTLREHGRRQQSPDGVEMGLTLERSCPHTFRVTPSRYLEKVSSGGTDSEIMPRRCALVSVFQRASRARPDFGRRASARLSACVFLPSPLRPTIWPRFAY